jgi:hypothetical protein
MSMTDHSEPAFVQNPLFVQNGLSLVAGPTDTQLAADLKKRTEAALAPVMEIMNEASRHGLVLGWAINRDQFGRNRIEQITVLKPL